MGKTLNEDDVATMLPNLTDPLLEFLRQHPPFDTVAEAPLRAFLAGVKVEYFPDGTEIAMQDGGTALFHIVQRGSVSARLSAAQEQQGPHQLVITEFGEGEGFPVAAALDDAASRNHYFADGDVFTLQLPMKAIRTLIAQEPAVRTFFERGISQLYQHSLRALRSHMMADNSTERTLHMPLRELVRRQPVTCGPGTPLREALTLMQEHNIGGLPVLNDEGYPEGIVIAQRLIGSVILPQLPLDTPVERIMSGPVVTLDEEETALQAALKMAQLRVRYVTVLREGRLIGILSERDLFHLHRRSLHSVTDAIGVAHEPEDFQAAAAEIRALAQQWLAQGSQVETMTWMVSSLNDQLTRRIFDVTRARHGLHGVPMCWVAFGSEGRHEQTLASDQDNGLVYQQGAGLDAAAAEELKGRLLIFARAVNELLDQCGFALCSGNVMASNPRLCQTTEQWLAVFNQVVRTPGPEQLLDAVIWFDMRPVAGDEHCILPLIEWRRTVPPQNTLFLRALCASALNVTIPVDGWRERWRRLTGSTEEATIDIKTQGTRFFVDAARILALATGSIPTSTVNRLRRAGVAAGVEAATISAALDSFHFLQSLRLRNQLRSTEGQPDASNGTEAPPPAQGPADHGTRIRLADLSPLDRRILKESMTHAEALQGILRRKYMGGMA